MKVVMCQNCGANYQLEDNDNVNAFECSVCSGSLKEIEWYPEEKESDFDYDYEGDSSSVVVYCTQCGLKYQLDIDDDINDFECSSCDGPLAYVNESNQGLVEESEVPYDNGYIGDDYAQVETSVDDTEIYADSDDEIIPAHADSVDDTELYDDSVDEIIPIHAEESYYADEIVPAHAEESYYADEIVPIHAEESYHASEETYQDEIDSTYYQDENPTYESYDDVTYSYSDDEYSDEDIIPVHAEGRYSDEDIIPVHAEGGYSDEDIIPVHAENRGNTSYLQSLTEEKIYEDEEYDYDIDAEDIINIRDDDRFAEIDEIIPIHAENRRNASNASPGFEFTNFSSTSVPENEEVYEDEEGLVEVTYIPKDSQASSDNLLSRRQLSKEDKDRFEKGKNQLVFDSREEYEAYVMARFRYYSALMDILKEEYLKDLDDQFPESSVSRFIKRGNESVKNMRPDASDSLVTPEMAQTMVADHQIYEPKRSYGDILIITGLFFALVGFAYYMTVNQLIYVLIIAVIGIGLLLFGIYQRYQFKGYITRGRIIREKLLTLPPVFHVFYAVQPPGSKDIINHVVVGPTGVFTILSKRYDPKEYTDKVKSDSETDGMLSESASIQDYRIRKNTLELQTGYDDNQTRFQFGNEEIHFVHNSRIKRKALGLNEDLAIFLDKNGLSGIYIEPLLGFINDDLAVLNIILTNEDLFMDELFHKMIYGQRRLDESTVDKISLLLSHYAADCSNY